MGKLSWRGWKHPSIGVSDTLAPGQSLRVPVPLPSPAGCGVCSAAASGPDGSCARPERAPSCPAVSPPPAASGSDRVAADEIAFPFCCA